MVENHSFKTINYHDRKDLPVQSDGCICICINHIKSNLFSDQPLQSMGDSNYKTF